MKPKNEEFPLDLGYKGERDYLHGTDIFSAIESHFTDKNLGFLKKLFFKKLSIKQLKVIWHKKDIDVASICGGGILSKKSSLDCRFWLVETSEFVNKRKPYNDGEIISEGTYFDESVSGHWNEYTCIENIVALKKGLCRYLNPKSDCPWLFAQLELGQQLPIEWETIDLICRRKTINRMLCSEIVIDGIDFGKISFISLTAR